MIETFTIPAVRSKCDGCGEVTPPARDLGGLAVMFALNFWKSEGGKDFCVSCQTTKRLEQQQKKGTTP